MKSLFLHSFMIFVGVICSYGRQERTEFMFFRGVGSVAQFDCSPQLGDVDNKGPRLDWSHFAAQAASALAAFAKPPTTSARCHWRSLCSKGSSFKVGGPGRWCELKLSLFINGLFMGQS